MLSEISTPLLQTTLIWVPYIVADCCKFISLFTLCVVAYVKKSTNNSAHNLTKFALTLEDVIWIMECLCIRAFIVADLAN